MSNPGSVAPYLIVYLLGGAVGLLGMLFGLRDLRTRRAYLKGHEYTGLGAVLVGSMRLFSSALIVYVSVTVGRTMYVGEREMETRTHVERAIQAQDVGQLKTLLKSDPRASEPGNLNHFAQKAVLEGKPQALAVLLEHGAQTETEDSSLLLVATTSYAPPRASNLEVIKVLVERGAKVNVQLPDQTRSTPLIQAAGKGELEVVDYLLDHGADYKLLTVPGVGALQVAAGHGYTPVVERLAQAGADVNAKNYAGLTVLGSAVKGKHEETVRWLRAHGAHE